MNETILILGAGENQLAVIRRAQGLGLTAAAMDGSPGAPGLSSADIGESGDIRSPGAVTEAARRHAVQAVFAASELAVEAAAKANAALGLPGASPGVARLVRDKAAMRQALEDAGLPNPAYARVETLAEAEQAVEAIGLPAMVKPADANASKGVRRLDAVEELPLAFELAKARSYGGGVLVEEYMDGEEYCVDGLAFDGVYLPGGITGKERSGGPYRFDTGIYMPGLPEGPETDAVEACLAEALSAIGYATGIVHGEVIVTDAGPRIVEIAGRPGGGRIPTDLIPLTYGYDLMADAFRAALGREPAGTRGPAKGAALYWFTSGSGLVTRIEGLEEVRALPGVRDAVCQLAPGDVIQHSADCTDRDKLGYVMTAADSSREAVAIAKAARDRLRIVTSKTL
jgi:biotin carboxylase